MSGYKIKNYSWEECEKKILEIITQMVKDGHSGQDIVFMGTKMMHSGIYVMHRNAEVYTKDNPFWDDIS